MRRPEEDTVRSLALSLAGLATCLFGVAAAQQPPAARTTVVAATEPAQVSVAHRGVDAIPFLTIRAANSDVRKTLSEMGEKAGVKVLLAPSAMGSITGSVDNASADEAFQSVAALAGLTARKIVLPEAAAATVTPETAGRFADALGTLPLGAAVADLATGKSLTVLSKPPQPATGQTAVYYVQGKMSPEQERLALARRSGQDQATQLSASGQAFVTQAQKSLLQMPLQQRMETMRNLPRTMFENMSDADREQLRQTFGGRGDRGGRGGRPPGM
jgi:hypothetical protein